MSAPQAFPAAWGSPEQGGDYVEGMTLRDYFAGEALPAIIAATSAGQHDPATKHGKTTEASICLDAYAIADEMLKAREATQ